MATHDHHYLLFSCLTLLSPPHSLPLRLENLGSEVYILIIVVGRNCYASKRLTFFSGNSEKRDILSPFLLEYTPLAEPGDVVVARSGKLTIYNVNSEHLYPRSGGVWSLNPLLHRTVILQFLTIRDFLFFKARHGQRNGGHDSL